MQLQLAITHRFSHSLLVAQISITKFMCHYQLKKFSDLQNFYLPGLSNKKSSRSGLICANILCLAHLSNENHQQKKKVHTAFAKIFFIGCKIINGTNVCSLSSDTSRYKYAKYIIMSLFKISIVVAKCIVYTVAIKKVVIIKAAC